MIQRERLACALTAVLGTFLAACGTAPSGATDRVGSVELLESFMNDADVPVETSRRAASREMVEDGTLTQTELTQSMDSATQCMQRRGIGDVDTNYEEDPGGWGGGYNFTYRTPDGMDTESVGQVVRDCEFESGYDAISALWAVIVGPTEEQQSRIRQRALACGQENGSDSTTWEAYVEETGTTPEFADCYNQASLSVKEQS